MLQKQQKVELRKKIRLGENSVDKDGYICEIARENIVVECYEYFPEDTILNCTVNLNGQTSGIELLVEKTVKEGLSYKVHGNVIKNSGIIRRLYREKVAEQGEKSKPRKSKWKFW